MISIEDKKKCCGCHACVNTCPKQCIQMVEDNEGFLYPSVNTAECVNCGLCEKVCPILNPIEEIQKEQKAALFQNNDPIVLKESTSGGFFTALSKWVIEQGGVVFGAAYDKDFVIKHRYVDNVDDLKIFRNSKYTQSVIGTTFKQVKEFLNEGRWVCFSGTPCQLEGLHKFLKKDYEKLVKIDIICHACPSPLVFRKFIEYQSNRLAIEPTNIKFRDKIYGYKYSVMSMYSGDKICYKEGIDTDIMLRAFFNNLSPRPSCFACPSKKRYRVTDFTMWDCFDVEKFSKQLDNDKGVTRIVMHTAKAESIWNAVKQQGSFTEISADDAVRGVKEMVTSFEANPRRDEFFADLNSKPADEVFAKWFPLTMRHRLEKQARLWSNRLGIYKIMKRIFKLIHGSKEIKR